VKRRPTRHTTVARGHPPKTERPPLGPMRRRPGPPPPTRIAHFVDDRDASLLDVIDSLLNKGVVLNADIILALADVDLVYVRLSALLCAADRVFPRSDK
jgi:hypothetical protein